MQIPTAEQLRFINTVLANDKTSTEAELTAHFVSQGIAPEAALEAAKCRELVALGLNLAAVDFKGL